MDERIVNLIVQTAEKLGFEAARLWPQIVAITWVHNICFLILNVIASIACIIAIVVLVRFANAKSPHVDDYDKPMLWIAVIASSAVLVVVLVACLVQLPGNITGILFPEATTVMKIVGK